MDKTLQQEDIYEVNGYDTRLQQLNKEQIQQAANQYLSGKDLIQILLLPESMEPGKK